MSKNIELRVSINPELYPALYEEILKVMPPKSRAEKLRHYADMGRLMEKGAVSGNSGTTMEKSITPSPLSETASVSSDFASF